MTYGRAWATGGTRTCASNPDRILWILECVSQSVSHAGLPLGYTKGEPAGLPLGEPTREPKKTPDSRGYCRGFRWQAVSGGNGEEYMGLPRRAYNPIVLPGEAFVNRYGKYIFFLLFSSSMSNSIDKILNLPP